VSDCLLHRIAAGDESAVAELMKRYGGLVYALARRFSSERADLEDAVQEVFAAIWKAANKYDPALGTEDTFVSMVTRRRLIDRRRRAVRRALPTLDVDFGAVVADRGAGGLSGGSGTSMEPSAGNGGIGGGGAEQVAEGNELAMRAMELLGTLRKEQREMIELSVRGFSHEQIAEQTGMPLGTVKTHVRRGLIALREAMSENLANRAQDQT
jgi:RNA polymerase sigma factor (sigma-70 family)